ncbi:hypothetical protein AVEN_106444-1 [Araneus ventricosus]|uniref:Uncharacterized protein n=1 Tax=Araneus ventricosus TaxID=182803 RepID=A0A4Y2AVM3_ARAVE|nr:hypothetical protein AVEN_106444-1 [Araneus ventricosus]
MNEKRRVERAGDARGVLLDLSMPSLYPVLLLLGYFTARAQETVTLTSSCCTLATGSCRSTCEELYREKGRIFWNHLFVAKFVAKFVTKVRGPERLMPVTPCLPL